MSRSPDGEPRAAVSRADDGSRAPHDRPSGPLANALEPPFQGFHDLMPFQVREVLLVATLYDTFIFEEDGHLAERIASGWELKVPPRVRRVSTTEEALEALPRHRHDLVIYLAREGEDLNAFPARVRAQFPDLPVVILAHDHRDVNAVLAGVRRNVVEGAFVWSGNADVFAAIINLVEDRRNVAHDVRTGGVRVLILVEDSIRDASRFLPFLYTAVVRQTHSLIAEGVNDLHKLFRMRARPKVLLARTFEDALELFKRFQGNVLGVISDVCFPRAGSLDPHAGVELCRTVRAMQEDLPFLLASAEPESAAAADAAGAVFLHKSSPTLLHELHAFLREHLGFGPFLFRTPDRVVVGRAEDLRELATRLREIPIESVLYHGERNHFSNWLAARGEFELAARLRPRRIADFADPEQVRSHLIEQIEATVRERQRGVISVLDARRFDPRRAFVRIGGGSIGGKARGIAFADALLHRSRFAARFPGIEIDVPRTVVVGTDAFGAFLEQNDLLAALREPRGDADVAARFLATWMPVDLRDELCRVLEHLRRPLAVRSSSALEDARGQPFAGVYATFMLPNNHPDPQVRLEQLLRAIRLVYASAFYKHSRSYLECTGNRLEEQLMAVVIQEVVGRPHERCFYPGLAGVAQSHDFYPLPFQKPEDGVASVAIGLGKTVVEGEPALRFSPVHPGVVAQLTDLDVVMDVTQRSLWAVDLSRPDLMPDSPADRALVALTLADAERHGTLDVAGSVLSAADRTLRDGLFETSPSEPRGPRIVTFAGVLKFEQFPLARILAGFLPLAQAAMDSPVEIEFAAEPDPRDGSAPSFHVLQLRPMAAQPAAGGPVIESLPDVPSAALLCRSGEALGNGVVRGIRDVVLVRPERFDRLRTFEIGREVEAANSRLLADATPYVLIGPGRWGTANPSLGIPVTWDEVSGARVIVEAGLPGFHVDASRGSHFFHNLVAFHVLYLAVSPLREGDRVDWAWLARAPGEDVGHFVRHVRLAEPLVVRVDGRSGQGVVVKG